MYYVPERTKLEVGPGTSSRASVRSIVPNALLGELHLPFGVKASAICMVIRSMDAVAVEAFFLM